MNPSGIAPKKSVSYFEFDFAKDGGAVGDIQLRGGSIPAGAMVDFGLIDVITPPTSGGAATIAIKLASNGDVKADTAIASFSSGANACVPNKAASNTIVLAANATPVMTISAAALTGGKLRVALEYFLTR